MHDLCKVPWDCHPEHPDFEHQAREIIATMREQDSKQFSRLAWVACVSVQLPNWVPFFESCFF